jgi:hypothetical protein
MVSLSPTGRNPDFFIGKEGWRENGLKETNSRDPEKKEFSNFKFQIPTQIRNS